MPPPVLPLVAVTWIPEEYWGWLLYGLAMTALVGTLLMILHMARRWRTIGARGQRLRYYSLLAFGILIAGAGAEMVQEFQSDGFSLSYRHLGAVICSVLLLVAAVWSLAEGVNPPDGHEEYLADEHRHP